MYVYVSESEKALVVLQSIHHISESNLEMVDRIVQACYQAGDDNCKAMNDIQQYLNICTAQVDYPN